MKIEWSSLALNQWRNIYKYCFTMFGRNVANIFADNIRKWEECLIKNPCIGQLEPLLTGRSKTYRSIIVHRNCKMVYYINNKNKVIRITSLWDTRREPTALESSL